MEVCHRIVSVFPIQLLPTTGAIDFRDDHIPDRHFLDKYIGILLL